MATRRTGAALTPLADPPPPTTGINHYWTYEEEPLPGIGKAMVNVGNGNTLVQVNDLDIPERGIDLAFRRSYNSQSGHDANNSDGSTPSVFGNGWTNTFDAHLAYDSADNIIQVYDIDGARYDYTSNGQGSWTPPSGQYAQLTSDGSCGYYWTKKTGTAYYFEAPNQPSTCGTQIPAGLAGRILAIQGRNINNALTFTYSWVNGDASNPENLTQIVVQHSDGQSLTLTFGLLNGTGPDELQSISRPDGATVSYEYDSGGDLLEVDRPGNATISAPTCSSTNTACTPETYTYGSGYLLATANSPRYTVSQRNNGGVAQEGDTVNLAFDASRRATSMTDYGVVNFIPQDGVSPTLPDPSQRPLQPSPVPTGLQTWYTESFSGYGSGVTTVSDSDGHSRMWTADSLWRVTETQEWTGSQWLVSYQTWDGNDNLLTFTDERGNVTTFAYDGNGNAIMEAQPSVTTSMGTFQPTAWYQYDQYSNLLYYCDPNWVHQHNGDYPGGSDPCTGSPSGVVHYVWATGSAPEIYGELSDTYTPLGYHHHLAYDSNGMPLSVVGDTITQADSTQRTPTQSFTYDAYGNLQTYNPGNGTWHLTYDTLNRVLTREDPDGVYSYICYYADGSTHYSETSYQRARDGGSSTCHATPPGIYATAFSYDADGDRLTQTAVHGGTWVSNSAPTLPTAQGITYKFYDADDRLVEVEQPYDATSDTYTNPWITRYFYDLSQNGHVSFNYGGTNYSAHGNLFKTVELLPSGTTYSATRGYLPATPEPSPTPVANTAYQDTKGTAFDALDRPTAKYSFVAPQSTPGPDTVNTETLTYDSAPTTLGLLAQDCNALSQCQTFSYDARGSESSLTFSDSTPSRTMAYDPDGRLTSATSSTFGTQSYTYDADGRLSTSQDPGGGGVTSPALLTHHYYADGKEEGLDVSSSALSQSGLFAYSYRTDGRIQTQAVNDASVPGIVNPGTTTVSYTYTAAGRLTQRAESGAAANSTPTRFTYDTNGNEITNTTPGAALSSMEYSAENEMLGFTGPTAPLGGSATYSYNARGELTRWPTQQFGINSPFPVWYADGAQVHQDYYGYVTWDDRMAVATQTESAATGSFGKAFDAAGRLTSWQSSTGTGCGSSAGRSYDAENHTITTSADYPDFQCNSQLLSNTVAWGPNGHPIMVGISSTQRDTLHWDGDVLLFTTNSSGQLDDIKIGAQGDILPRDPKYKGLTFYDRDPSGGAMGCHNATGATYIGPSETYSRTTTGKIGSVTYAVSPCSTNTRFAHVTGTPSMPTSVMWWSSPTSSLGFAPGIGAGGVLGMPRTDGYADGTDSIQGTRTYDPNVGTWTTPDVYAGNVSDPASQKSYMWNGNNPVQFSDPSGYCPECIVEIVEEGGAAIEEGIELGAELSGDARAATAIEQASELTRTAETAADFAKSQANTSTALRNVARQLFQESDRTPGGTANAVRSELANGRQVGGKFHLEKGAILIRTLQNILSGKSGALTQAERAAANSLLKDLQQAYGRYDPNSFIRNNVPPPVAPEPKPAPPPK
ncbi:MAG TPA: DUF6531 domain-containing protein [Candidatus Dormibacteraeota bacterium]|nr:DUF6531 domain-containing protein [Candidatus Dormibacteraeota bacterium]